MEDLTPYRSLAPAHTMPAEALTAIGRAIGKVKLKLSRQQLGSIAMIMQVHTHKARPKGVFELAQLHEAYKLAEKLRLKLMHNPVKVKLNLTMTEAAALYNALDSMEFVEFAQYEANLVLFVISEIDRQTV